MQRLVGGSMDVARGVARGVACDVACVDVGEAPTTTSTPSYTIPRRPSSSTATRRGVPRLVGGSMDVARGVARGVACDVACVDVR